MNTLDFLRQKAEQFGTRLTKSGIMSVVRHIEMAERHFAHARENSDSDLFTDVIYRINHAFEGILKESYKILAEKDPTKKRPFDIETYLAHSNVFQPRVMELFTNYRTKWRNPSTHDHVITFTESEAFLSILSVTSFVGILIDQMIEKVTFDQESQRLDQESEKIQQVFAEHKDEPLIDKIIYLFQTVGPQAISAQLASTETELIALLRAFLSSVVPEVKILQEPLFQDDIGSLRPDFILEDGKERIILEVKRYRKWSKAAQRAAIDQLRRYLNSSDIPHGILFLYPASDAEPTDEQYDKVIVDHLDSDRFISTIRFLPKNKKMKNA